MNERQQAENKTGKNGQRPAQNVNPATNTEAVDRSPAVSLRKGNHLTPAMVLRMQNLYGNAYVQRVIAAQRTPPAAPAQIQRDDDDSGGGFAGDSGFYGSTDQGAGSAYSDSGFDSSANQVDSDFGGDSGFYGAADQGGDSSAGDSDEQGNGEAAAEWPFGSGLSAGLNDGFGDSSANDNSANQNSDTPTDPSSGDTNGWKNEEGVAKQETSEAAGAPAIAQLGVAQAEQALDAAVKSGDPAAIQIAAQLMGDALANSIKANQNMSTAAGNLGQIQQKNKGQWSQE